MQALITASIPAKWQGTTRNPLHSTSGTFNQTLITSITSKRRQLARRDTRRWSPSPCAAGSFNLGSAEEVRRFAREQFQSEVDQSRPDTQISLAKACMLVALEEEAAVEADLLQQRHNHLTLHHTPQHPNSRGQQSNFEPEGPNRVGTASSWSLSRLDSLAEEVKSCFMTQYMSLWAPHQQHTDDSPSPSEDSSAAERRASHSTASTSSPDKSHSSPGSNSTPEGKASPTDHSESNTPSSTQHAVARAMQQYPMQTVAALNTVLFERHGYNRMRSHGNPREAQLSSVMDSGAGTPAALAVLYMEVAKRLGMPMAAQPLEAGRHCVIWPEHGLLRAGGEDFVIDAYSQGAVYSMAEVAELFDVSTSSNGQTLQPASKRELLAAMLAALRDSHWCKAVGCDPEPGLMTPISLEAAANGAVQPMQGFDIERALAAAERCLFLQPDARETQLEHVLLLYFASEYQKAHKGMQQYMQKAEGDEQYLLKTAFARVSYLLYENQGWPKGPA